jgi:hypothetical protein
MSAPFRLWRDFCGLATCAGHVAAPVCSTWNNAASANGRPKTSLFCVARGPILMPVGKCGSRVDFRPAPLHNFRVMFPATSLPAPPPLYPMAAPATAAGRQAGPKPQTATTGEAYAGAAPVALPPRSRTFFVPRPALAPGYSDFSPYLDPFSPGNPHLHAEHSTN